ncbi:transcription factor [Ceratocystis lukuohia]|uniref:Transcription factor n=1 Tax=Ceratocystis lukuohia TaxID=2019550 RepID=A0ABR4MKP8_9PEZI
MSVPSKQRVPRLRASCDGCFQAKVKCSKARPVCSRCLISGIECRYSPSSRAGKPRADFIASAAAYHMAAAAAATYGPLSPLSDHLDASAGNATVGGNAGLFMHEQAYPQHMFGVGDAWMHTDVAHAEWLNSHDVSVTAAMASSTSCPAELYNTSLPWNPAIGLGLESVSEVQQGGPPGQAHAQTHAHARSLSLDMDATQITKHWLSQGNAHELSAGYGMGAGGGQFAPPTSGDLATHQRSGPEGRPTGTGSCDCFAALLESLQELYRAAALTSVMLEAVIVINKKAVGGCATMLSCSRCVNRSSVESSSSGGGLGSETTQNTAMLLATVLGKALGLYAAAVQTPAYASPASPAGASPYAESSIGSCNGSFSMTSSPAIGPTVAPSSATARFPIEFIAGELGRVETVLGLFQDTCGQISGSSEIGGVLSGYLAGLMQSTMAGLNMRRRESGYQT